MMFDQENVGFIRYKCSNVLECISIGYARISTRSVLLSFVPIRLSLYLLGSPMKQWQGALETLTLFTKTKLIGLAMIKTSFTLELKG
jgi:hypothetical protein